MTDVVAAISGTTRLAAIIGDPIEHSLSPVLHNAAYRAMGLDQVYVALKVPAGGTAAAVDAVRTLGLAGLSVTMPHKEAAVSVCDVLTPEAEMLRSVNTVTPLADGRLEGSTTDGAGFVRSLHDAGHDPRDRRVLVLGTGGAARAVAHALAADGAEVAVAGRRADATSRAAALASGAAVPWADRLKALITSEIVVNATPIGMGGDAALPIPAEALRPDLVVADLVYHPLTTPLLSAAAAAGAGVVDGLGMLVQQAALQIERWVGATPPLAAMRQAVEHHLAISDGT